MLRSALRRPLGLAAVLLALAGCNGVPVITPPPGPGAPEPGPSAEQATCLPPTSSDPSGAAETATGTLAQRAVPLRAPAQCLSEGGRLVRDLYVQFSETRIPGSTGPNGEPIPRIWTRAYGLEPVDYDGGLPTLDIPGPTFVYHPGDWLELTLINQLNREADRHLVEFEDLMDAHSSQDDIEQPVSHDLNIPHNADNTNLHVHGMHVDPKQDDVTLIILPEDDNPSNYTPMLQHYVPDINRWWRWKYGYRLPQDHLPGTHWYHDHKHGATSTHVENGMAGTLLVRPEDDALSIVPGLWDDDPAESHDRVLIVQEIANYGAQQGAGNGSGKITDVERQDQNTDSTSTDWPEITVNGQHQPNLVLAPGQTERWRIVTAGSNHRNASFYWVAELTPPETMDPVLKDSLLAVTDFASACPYIRVGANTTCTAAQARSLPGTFPVVATPPAGSVDLVAIDGITLSAPVPLGIERPFVAGPGNRADLVVRFAEADRGKTFSLVKNFDNPPPMYLLAENADYGDLFRPTAEHPDAPYWRYLALTTSGGTVLTEVVQGDSTTAAPTRPFTNLQGDPYALGTTPAAFKRTWPSNVAADGTPQPIASGTNRGQILASQSLVPILSAREGPGGLEAVVVGTTDGQGDPAGVGWGVVSRVAGGGVVDTQVLMTVQVEGDFVDGPTVNPAHMKRLSPTTDDPANTLLVTSTSYDTTIQGIPAYVSPISPGDLEGRQVIVFDKSGVDFVYNQVDDAGAPTGQTTTIHQFSLNGRQFDLQDFVGNPGVDGLIAEPVPALVKNVFNPDTLGVYRYNGAGTWTNQAVVDGETVAYYTNPGYYREVVPRVGPPTDASMAQVPYFTYRDAAPAPPDYRTITGLDTPRQPEATTAEEWMLVNNSGSFHPFHIHINPLLLTEVGQLSYDTNTSEWSIETLSKDDPLGYALDNWWDVVIIPPYGYVTFKTWFNIPNQRPRDQTDPATDFVVDENANVFGSWVYHCHILRHEDRGMMMVINVRPKPVPGGHPAGGAYGSH